LEEIPLPLLEGHLKNVPMEEVSILNGYRHIGLTNCAQNLREEVAMDVDEDEDGTQQVKKVADYGIEVDFESLDDDERQVFAIALLNFTRG
jgi:structural maintenance of chromosome 1